MKKVTMLLATVLLAVGAHAATVVLTGGKRIEVAAYSVSGSYVNVHYANGREEWYPLAAVDLAATRAACGQSAAAPATTVDSGPHSPFFGARASAKPGEVVVTDADVKHVDTEATGGETKKKEDEPPENGPVVLVGYEKQPAGKGAWEITATVANKGKNAVQNVSSLVRILDDKGKAVTTGSGSVLAKLDPGAQGKITTRVATDADPAQVIVELSWQEIRSGPTVPGKPATPAVPKPQEQALRTNAPAPGLSIPAGASPNSVPSNIMSVVAPTTVGNAPQVPPAPK